MTRIDIINKLIKVNNYKKYLEIGVRNPNDCFNKIKVKSKHSVDPAYETDEFKYDFKMTSDEFFINLKHGRLSFPKDYKWDIIFIDGLHTAEQVYVDIQNALIHLSPTGMIVLHDCCPPTVHHAREDYYYYDTPAGGEWNGTTWKAIQKVRQEAFDFERDEYNLCTVDTDWGVGIIKRGKWGTPLRADFNNFYSYQVFSENVVEVLNLMSPEDFDKTLETFFKYN